MTDNNPIIFINVSLFVNVVFSLGDKKTNQTPMIVNVNDSE